MNFLLPDNAADAARMADIGNRLAAIPLGRRYLNSLITAMERDVPDVQLSFDRQLSPDVMGLCYRHGQKKTIALNPVHSDAALVATLAHEICHLPQPRAPLSLSAGNMQELAVACTRMLEGDAFAAQFVFALGSKDAEVARENMEMFTEKVKADHRDIFIDLAARWQHAKGPAQQQQVLAAVFWHVQTARLANYDTQVIEHIAIMQKDVALEPMAVSALDQATEFVAKIGFLPARIGGTPYNDYLGHDPQAVAQVLLKAGAQAAMMHNAVSVKSDDVTLPYSKPAGSDSLKFGK